MKKSDDSMEIQNQFELGCLLYCVSNGIKICPCHVLLVTNNTCDTFIRTFTGINLIIIKLSENDRELEGHRVKYRLNNI